MRLLWRYLISGSDELRLPKAWLENRERLRAYEGYTRRQLQQGSVVKDVAEKRREAFWQAIEAKRNRVLPDNAVPFTRQSQR